MPQLGNWDPSSAVCTRVASEDDGFTDVIQIPLDSTNYPVWGATVYLPPGITFQYKLLRKEPNGTVRIFVATRLPFWAPCVQN